MKKTLTLENPIMIDGKSVSELTYDPFEITNDMFIQACALSSEITKTKTIAIKVRENDYALHLYLGYMAIIAVNPDIDIKDLQRVKGYDLLQIADIGLLFTMRKSEAVSTESSSDGQSANTADTTTQASQSLDASGSSISSETMAKL